GDLGLALLGGALVLAHHVDARADGQRHGGRDADRDEPLPRPETRVRGWVLAPVVHGDAPHLPFRCPCSVVSISTSPQTPTNVELPLRSEVGARVRPGARSMARPASGPVLSQPSAARAASTREARYDVPKSATCTSSGCSWCSGTRARHPSASGAASS